MTSCWSRSTTCPRRHDPSPEPRAASSSPRARPPDTPTPSDRPGATLLETGEERYLRVGGPVTLDHEEHAPITVVPGTYRVVIQREYVPAEIAPSLFRRVVD